MVRKTGNSSTALRAKEGFNKHLQQQESLQYYTLDNKYGD